ncbi:ATP-dependent Clp protease proteolytic subunit [Paenibacillus oenotherae]|uniref:ATP-dependent Clp protease proteolytic subunit n=1 Tax=Paenibacillus oenotherae TaxID=1435645 RepID=A0ABS7D187_9BACL|nr:NfeD family protein [Paenibacillus oenotherae]MBW7473710.1 ATP-dependent Clp protease proteolytic subunit [Paenibacillus oenotherae]
MQRTLPKLGPRMIVSVVALLAIMLLALLPVAAYAADSNADNSSIGPAVYVIRAEQTVESGLQAFLERAYEEAEEARAEHILLVINTLGGRVDSAEEIGHLVRTSKVPTTAFVQGKAVSAGTYIALNAKGIIMEPGSAIGAAAVVDGSGELIDNPKIISYWTKAMMEAAQLNGRNTDIAAKMVDPRIKLKLPELGQTLESGEILTLSATEAVKVGYAEFTARTIDEALAAIGLDERQIVEIKPSVLEKIGQFLTSPVVVTLLLIIGIVGVAIELLVPGFGFPGIAGIIAFALYFFGHFVAGFAGMESVVLFIVGIVLLVSELFIPSFGILGILGTVSLIAGIVTSASDTRTAIVSLAIALAAAALIVIFVAIRFKHRGVWNKFILSDRLTTDEGYVSNPTKVSLLGKKGVTLTPLRPAGTVTIDDERIDVVTDGEFISAGIEVKVIKVDGARVIVQQWNEKANQ